MDQAEITALISKTAALMEQFERRVLDITERQQSMSAELQRVAQQIPALVSDAASRSLQALPRQVIEKVGSGLDAPVSAYETRLQQAGAATADASTLFAAQLARIEHLHRHLAWKVVGLTLGSLVLLLAGSVWLSSHYRQVIVDNQVASDLLRAYNRADVVLCGNGQLCANVDPKAPRVGERRQYAPVNPR